MKRTITVLVIMALMVVGIWGIWFYGIVFEYEYPYTFTLMKVRNAKSVNGVPVSQIIRGDGAKWPSAMQWHTDSYFADNCGDAPGLVCVLLRAPDNSTSYYFAYSYETHTLVPLTAGTASHFPSLMPSNDPVRIVQEMNGNTGAYGNGYGTFELPEKWFHKVTHTDTNNVANGGQPPGSVTN
jgi:hypothetical protein